MSEHGASAGSPGLVSGNRLRFLQAPVKDASAPGGRHPSGAEPCSSPASFASRMVAFLIDLLVLAILHLALCTLLGFAVVRLEPFQLLAIPAAFGTFMLAPPLLALLYFTLFHTWGGQTPGKMIMGVRLISVSGNQGRVPTGLAFLRWAGYALSALPLAAGFLWMVVDKDRRAWHDKLAGTRVVDW